MIPPAVLDAMVATGCTAEQVSAVVKAFLASEEAALGVKPRSPHADRQARYRERKASQSVTQSVTVTESDGSDVTSVTRPSLPPSPFPDKETSPRPPKEINSTPLPPAQPFSLSAGEEFDRFWEIYPNKVGKADARKKFQNAVRKVGIEAMLDALLRYANKTDDRPWLNPATWLFQERWGDQPAQVARGSPSRKLTGLAAITADFMKELTEDGYADESQESRDHQDDVRLPLLTGPRNS